MKTRVAIFAFIAIATLSCTHWILGSEVRLQIENRASKDVYDLAIVSENGKVEILVKDTVKKESKSKVYDVEWVGEFNFAIFSNNEMMHLGKHRLNSGSVLARIEEKDGNLTAVFK